MKDETPSANPMRYPASWFAVGLLGVVIGVVIGLLRF
jgi:hypothetical protein